VDRVADAYRLSYGQFKPSSSAWDENLFTLKIDVHNALLAGGGDAAAVLRHPAESTFFWGFDAIAKAPPGEIEPHELVIRRLNPSGDWRDLYSIWLVDALNSLAEAIGARRMIYPEMQPSDIGAHYADARTADQILDDIDNALGVEIVFPNPFPSELGLSTRRGIVGFRSVQAVYQAWRIAQIANHHANFKVLEIGAGLGRTAYFAYQLGVRNYTIVDIPLTNAAQGYFLGRTIGPSQVCLYGEDSAAQLRILPSTALSRIDEAYDLVVNVDSLTEMATEVAHDYWRFIREHSNALLSVNHEVNPLTVRSLYADARGVRATRFPYWMRRGYVEEFITWDTIK